MNRREFLATTVLAAGFAAAGRAADDQRTASGLIDTNVSLSRCPFRHLPLDETSALVARLRAQDVTQAWAGTFDALLHKDLSSANARLAAQCREAGEGFLIPMGAINPMQPGWEEDVRRCVEVHGMPGLRLHPNYHGYKLDEPIFERVLSLAEKYRLLVQITVVMEDERTLHPLVNVPATNTTPLAALARKYPRVRLQLLNAFRTLRGKPVADLAASGVRFEIAMLEGVAGVGNLLAQIEADRLFFGSHAPFFYFESAQLKLRESPLTEKQLRAVSAESARQFLAAR